MENAKTQTGKQSTIFKEKTFSIICKEETFSIICKDETFSMICIENILNDFYGLQRWHEYRTCATTKDMLHRMQCIIWFATWEQKRKIICKQGYKRVFNRFPRWEMRGGGEYTKNCVFLQKWATISLLDTWPDTRINLRDTQKSRHRCIQVLDFQCDPFFQIICSFYFSSRQASLKAALTFL